MEKRILLLSLFLVSLFSFGQDYGNSADAVKLCSALQVNNFGTDIEADKGLDKILSVIGASKRFVLQPCDNINNAVATSYKGIRYILYDRDFMSSINSGNNWGNLFILAHEVGHHINGHSLDLTLFLSETIEPETLANKRKQELEADEFAGFILAKLGATISQASSSVNLLASNNDDKYSTHPSKSKRLSAINIGYNKAKENVSATNVQLNKTLSSEDYFYSAFNKLKLGDINGAMSDYNKTIGLNPNNINAYQMRASIKYNLEDYPGAILDYTRVIELEPENFNIYRERGELKEYLKDYKGALFDFRKSIEFYSDNDGDIDKFLNKVRLIIKTEAIADYLKLKELNPNSSDFLILRFTLKNRYNALQNLFVNYSKSIEANPNDIDSYLYRGALNKIEGNEFCKDWEVAANLGNKTALKWLNLENCN